MKMQLTKSNTLPETSWEASLLVQNVASVINECQQAAVCMNGTN